MVPLFLAQLFGLYFLIVGIIVYLRGSSMMPAVKDLVANRGFVMVLGLVELIAGLALVLTYGTVTFDWMGIIALLGWVMLIEALVYLLLPYKGMQQFVRFFNTPLWYNVGSLLSLVLGAYLAGIGFGIW